MLLSLLLALAMGLSPTPPPLGPFIERCDQQTCTLVWQQQSTANGVYLLVDNRIVYEASSVKDRRHTAVIERSVWDPGNPLIVWEVWTGAGVVLQEARHPRAPMRVWLAPLQTRARAGSLLISL